MRDTVIDNAAGFPATSVAKDVAHTSSEYEQEQHEQRVDELNSDYDDFLRSKDADPSQSAAPRSPIVIDKNEPSDPEDDLKK